MKCPKRISAEYSWESGSFPKIPAAEVRKNSLPAVRVIAFAKEIIGSSIPSTIRTASLISPKSGIEKKFIRAGFMKYKKSFSYAA